MDPRPYNAEAKIKVDATSSVVDVIMSSLKPELERSLSERSSVKLESYNGGIVIRVVADDMVALRSAVNSYLYWIQGIIDIGNRVTA